MVNHHYRRGGIGMQIRRLRMENFRSVASGEVMFKNHTVLIGGNSVGKSTVCEALDLLLGPDRLSRANPINEHDFHRRAYLGDDGEPIKVELEVVLTDLGTELEAKYRAHREYWDTENETLLDRRMSQNTLTSTMSFLLFALCSKGFTTRKKTSFRQRLFCVSASRRWREPRSGQSFVEAGVRIYLFAGTENRRART
jgi:hypothetical protein